MSINKLRHNRHILLFDFHEDKDELKIKSDKLINFLNFDKNEFFLMETNKDNLCLSTVLHEEQKYTSILIFKKNIGFTILIREFYFNKDVLNNLEETLKEGRKNISVLKNVILNNKKLNVLNDFDNLNINPINIKSESKILKLKECRTDDGYSLKLLEKIEKYQIDSELANSLLEREKFIYNYFNGTTVCYQSKLNIDNNSEFEYLFREVS